MTEHETARHTPGPWSQGPTEGIGQVGRLRVVDVNGIRIADCEAPKRPDASLVFARIQAEDDANARLIASAPELLEALKALHRHCGDHGWWLKGHAIDVMDQSHTAITKAEGV